MNLAFWTCLDHYGKQFIDLAIYVGCPFASAQFEIESLPLSLSLFFRIQYIYIYIDVYTLRLDPAVLQPSNKVDTCLTKNRAIGVIAPASGCRHRQ